jgi:hypothetical protein
MKIESDIKNELISQLEALLRLKDEGDKKWTRGFADGLRYVLELDDV